MEVGSEERSKRQAGRLPDSRRGRRRYGCGVQSAACETQGPLRLRSGQALDSPSLSLGLARDDTRMRNGGDEDT
jgi:hypothetical protein